MTTEHRWAEIRAEARRAADAANKRCAKCGGDGRVTMHDDSGGGYEIGWLCWSCEPDPHHFWECFHARRVHWGYAPVLTISVNGRRPATAREWLRFLWNFDIFFGPIPFLKASLAANALVLWWGVR